MSEYRLSVLVYGLYQSPPVKRPGRQSVLEQIVVADGQSPNWTNTIVVFHPSPLANRIVLIGANQNILQLVFDQVVAKCHFGFSGNLMVVCSIV